MVKKFLLNALLFAAICLATIITVLLFKKHNYVINSNYLAAIIDKDARLDSIKNNRLILVGGSNLAFGINSALIQKETGKNVINLGLHGGLGSEFVLNDITLHIKENDIILLSLEYPFFDDKYDSYADLLDLIQKMYPQAKAYYHLSFYQKLEVNYEDFVKSFNDKAITKCGDDPYTRCAFNKYGDDTAHLDKPNQRPMSASSVMTKIKLDQIINRLKDLSAKCKEKNARIFLLYPVLARSEFQLNHVVIKDLQQQIDKDIGFIPVLNKPDTFVFDDNLFFDSVYHPNRQGRELRTTMLISILKTKVL